MSPYSRATIQVEGADVDSALDAAELYRSTNMPETYLHSYQVLEAWPGKGPTALQDAAYDLVARGATADEVRDTVVRWAGEAIAKAIHRLEKYDSQREE